MFLISCEDIFEIELIYLNCVYDGIPDKKLQKIIVPGYYVRKYSIKRTYQKTSQTIVLIDFNTVFTTKLI